ncbi:MAG: dihydrofolate reductase [Pseudomonadales bacterium]|nr:dihydrofolate reductase [Pseudomonadales bacterium]
MDIAIIVAMAENGVIGRNNQLPWYLPEDLRYFKQTTMAKPIVMGRKTFESIGRALPGRTNIVISRQEGLELPVGVKHATSLEQAIEIAEAVCLIEEASEVMIIGGEQIYKAAMPLANRLYLTRVHGDVEGDASFTGFDVGEWTLKSEQKHLASGSNPYDYSFCVYEK